MKWIVVHGCQSILAVNLTLVFVNIVKELLETFHLPSNNHQCILLTAFLPQSLCHMPPSLHPKYHLTTISGAHSAGTWVHFIKPVTKGTWIRQGTSQRCAESLKDHVWSVAEPNHTKADNMSLCLQIWWGSAQCVEFYSNRNDEEGQWQCLISGCNFKWF